MQEFIQVCTFSTTDADIDTKVLIALGDHDQANDIEFVFSDGTPKESLMK
ncbi:hypothetical protein [Cytobacillus sp. IB215316]|nr:hypothetical protein [Cytobacillus sp. IB215316]MDX8362583.1 hypothetical protein [Cytobacillus sp. IB215316]